MKRSRKKKETELDNGFPWQAVLGGLAIIAILSLFLYYVYSGRVTSSDYEGKIVDRWADYTASTQGSRPYFSLLIESSDGKRLTVRVDSNVYELARVGMRIKSRNGQVVLIDSQGNSLSK
jgi:hypothetical protein